ncbi:MAG: YjjG family noncanonical pyrimidine nucleotidase [Bacteroidetes bacterium]|nr:YjjG family noncanonical pyrimidine nucleotidase [Bacteroidota bacterium]MBU1484312.1 YjjG family noncanonical pyrimidine nucleotidase [Bacteroidota bacterium]MBU2266821.1 YjjG family noncanonical pyrimidine nucleotidase [Bacteroidota bacterium]MBU2377024.1 YjjG family noncanonical pyrimidine nucleotidase [Bacteroidota bacterium]
MKSYQHIFFDLDHTLWDFDKNAEETLSELYFNYQLENLGLNSCDIFIETYTKNNHQLWADYHLGKITKEALRETRFKKTFLDLGLDESIIPSQFEDDYVNICPTKSNLFPHTHETLTYLQQKYKLHLISNGFKESTEYKVKNTNLTPYFQNVIISEVLGINKPDKAIFQYAIDKAKASTQQSLMIGDSIEADVRGALNFGMDAIYFNPNFAEIPEDVSWHINHLEELTRIL